MKTITQAVTLAALLALAACATDQTREEETDAFGSSTSGTTGGPTGAGTGSSVVGAPVAGAAATVPQDRIFYFAFDSSELNSEGAALADAWAQYLAANPSARVRLEGHADERGTREYNIGLGERRANAVLQALTSRGVAARQASVTSFGEERPVAMGHDEAAWTQNRRVELVQ
jgi:peptidoglycan-associated lipoprotein